MMGEPKVNKLLTEQETTSLVLTAIRQHEPELQNKIVATVLKELAIDRSNRFIAVKSERERAEGNLSEFIKISHVAEVTIKECGL